MNISDFKKYLARDLTYIEDRWNQRANIWDNNLSNPSSHINRENSYVYFLELLNDLTSNISIKDNKSFLDLGCGTGALIENCSKKFDTLIGIDISERMLMVAMNKHIKNAIFIKLDCFKLFLVFAQFDFIASRGVLLSHYGHNNSIILLTEIYSHLKTDGYLILDALNKNCLTNPSNKYLFTSNELKSLASKIGFRSYNVIERRKEYPILYLIAKKVDFYFHFY